MRAFRSLTSKLVLCAVAIGMTLAGIAGPAGASGATGSTAIPTQQAVQRVAHALKVAEAHFSCTNASRVESSVQQLRNKFATTLATLEANQATAMARASSSADPKKKAHQEYLAKSYSNRVAKVEKYESHRINSRFLARAARLSNIAQAKCK